MHGELAISGVTAEFPAFRCNAGATCEPPSARPRAPQEVLRRG
jgi:hypothetical protein